MEQKYDWNQKFENWEEEKPKWEPFHGYVREPWPIFIIALIILVLFVVFTIWATIDLICSVKTEVLYCSDVVFDAFEQDGPIYVLTAGEQEYHLFSNAVADKLELENLVAMKKPVSVSYRKAGSQDASPYSICSIREESGKIYVSSEATAQAEQLQSRKALSAIWLFCVGFCGFFAAGYYVLCNAPRFPKISAFLVRKSYRNF